jgi:tetratricopeptide (TPR) repeat protein
LGLSLLVGLGLDKDGTLGDMPATGFQSIWATGELVATGGFVEINNLPTKFSVFCDHAMRHPDVPHLFVYCHRQMLDRERLIEASLLPETWREAKFTSVCWQQGDRWMDEAREALDGELSGIYLVKLGTSIEDFQTLLDALRIRAGKAPLHVPHAPLCIGLDDSIPQFPLEGRDELLQELTDHVVPDDTGEQRPGIVRVHGLSGVGKSRLVRELANNQRHATSPVFSLICWLDARPESLDQTNHVESELHAVLQHLDPDAPDLGTIKSSGLDLRRLLRNALASVRGGPVLWIIDNLDDLDIEPWLMDPAHHVVVTTCHASLRDRGGVTLRVPALDEDDELLEAGVRLLLRHARDIDIDHVLARELVRRVGGHPIALTNLSNHILHRRNQMLPIALEMLVDTFDERPISRVSEDPEEGEARARAATMEALSTTFALSYQPWSPEAKHLAHTLAWFAPSPIPFEFVSLDRFVGPIVRELIDWDVLSGNVYQQSIGKMHRLQASYLREVEGGTSHLTAALEHISPLFIDVENPYRWPLLTALEPHAETIFDHLCAEVVEGCNPGLVFQLTSYRHARGDIETPFILMERMEQWYEQAWDESDPMLEASIAEERCICHMNRQERKRALELAESVLECRELYREASRQEPFPGGEPALLRAIANHAHALLRLEDLEGARRELERYLDEAVGLMANDSDAVLMTRLDLVEVYAWSGQFEEAFRMLQDVFEDMNTSADLLPQTRLCAYNIFGEALREFDALDAAIEVLEYNLHECIEQWGELHPDSMSARNNLAIALSRQGSHERAIVEYRHLITLRSDVYGPDHGAVVNARKNLAVALTRNEQFEDALTLYDGVLEYQENHFDADNTRIFSTKLSMGRAFLGLEQWEQALPLLRDAYEHYLDTRGEDYSLTVRALEYLTQCRQHTSE